MPSEQVSPSAADSWGTLRWIPADWDRSAAPASSYVCRWFSPAMGHGMWLRGRSALDMVGLVEAVAAFGLVQRYRVHPGRIEWGHPGHRQQCPATLLFEWTGRPDWQVVVTPRHCTRTLPNPPVISDADQIRKLDRIQASAAQILPAVRKAMTPPRPAHIDNDLTR